MFPIFKGHFQSFIENILAECQDAEGRIEKLNLSFLSAGSWNQWWV